MSCNNDKTLRPNRRKQNIKIKVRGLVVIMQPVRQCNDNHPPDAVVRKQRPKETLCSRYHGNVPPCNGIIRGYGLGRNYWEIAMVVML
jgi:hypothetical protein